MAREAMSHVRTVIAVMPGRNPADRLQKPKATQFGVGHLCWFRNRFVITAENRMLRTCEAIWDLRD